VPTGITIAADDSRLGSGDALPAVALSSLPTCRHYYISAILEKSLVIGKAFTEKGSIANGQIVRDADQTTATSYVPY
jgi:hypothetical protein